MEFFYELLYIYQTICSFNKYNNHHLQSNTGSNTFDMASHQCVIGLWVYNTLTTMRIYFYDGDAEAHEQNDG